MNQLIQLRDKAKEHFDAMPPATRWMALALVALMLFSLLWTLSSIDTATRTIILSDLSPGEVSRAESAFAAAQLSDYEVVQGGGIRVALSQRSRFLNALAEADALPADRDDAPESSLQSTWFDSPKDKERKHQWYRERELEKLLRKRPQIDDAWVEFDEAQSDGFGDPLRTCFIQVQQSGNVPIDRAILRNIWETAPSYFAGLSLENVRVIDIGASQTVSFGEDLETQNPVLKAKAQWEEYYGQKARRLLSNYGNVQLMVDVDLDPRVSQTTESISYDPTNASTESNVIRSEIETTGPSAAEDSLTRSVVNTSMSTDAERTSEPARFSATHLNEPARLVKRTERTTELTKQQFGQEATVTRTAGLHPTEIRIRVGIPESHYLDVFRQRLGDFDVSTTDAPNPTHEELSAIREELNQKVQSLMEGMVSSASSTEQPKVKVFSYADIAIPEPTTPTAWDWVRQWLLQNWQTLALIGLALGCLRFVHRMVNASGRQTEAGKIVAASRAEGIPLSPAHHDDVAAAVLAAETGGISNELNSDNALDSTVDSPKSRVSQLVLRYPDATQATLQSWLQDAA